MNIAMVKFKNGTYGVRRGWIFFKFLDSRDFEYWHPLNEYWKDKIRMSKEDAEKCLEALTDYGRPVE
jgi:hypothetical protein